jgi:uncharacterized protein YwgA/O-acetyl-ADP-ribose deacetylase (regulator of RNase III)
MVQTIIGDLFESKAQTLVNTVNTVGVMGKGVALEFKKRFPDMYRDYEARCAAKQVRLGEPYLFRRVVPPWILNFPTKDDWRSVSRLSDIVKGLEHLERHYREWEITSLAVPPLGCGNGQLEWRVVGPTLYRHLNRLNVPVELYAPFGTPREQLEEPFLAETAVEDAPSSRIPATWVALVAILARIDEERYHWPVGRTSFQKIVYFATEAGLPTHIQHERGSYGPFSSAVKTLITKLVNHQLLVERKLGRMFALQPGPTYEDAAKAFQRELAQWEPIIERVADLFLRMRTQQAEVAASVFFAARALAADAGSPPNERQVLEAVQQWKLRRRPPLDDHEVATAIRNLNLLRWLNLPVSQDLPLPKGEFADLEAGV